MRTTIPPVELGEQDMESVLALGELPDWDNFIGLMEDKRDEIINLFLEGDSQQNEFYKGALFMLREIVGLEDRALTIIETQRNQEDE